MRTPKGRSANRSRATAVFMAGAACASVVAGCGPAALHPRQGTIAVVAAENEYASVVSQVGGRYVSVAEVMSNPNTDPHEFEASASVAQEISQARLLVQNGDGYDGFMDKLESASPNRNRHVVVVESLPGVPKSAFNPHLWYDPATMPAVAKAVTASLSAMQPAHASYFRANEARFDRSLARWQQAIAELAKRGPVPVAVTEPVADYLLEAAGWRILTPDSLQSAVMNGTDPSPQDISLERSLIRSHEVEVLLYNRQVTDPLTQGFLALAKQAKIPVVGVYETMPVPGYDYQSWMLAESKAMARAVASGISTETL